MSKSASKIRDIRSSTQKEVGTFKSRRSVSVDTRNRASVDTRARGSYVPDKRRPSSEDRISGNKLLRWGNARKSSINLQETKRKDTRPLTDKAYQKRRISELVEFLNENGFNPPISTSKLVTPTKKDFETIFQFLYRLFDPVYEVKRIEEEAPKILKNLMYPYNINKSAFVYVARTNWPHLLGALVWLMDLNKFTMRVDMKNLFETAGDDEEAEIHKILVRYICHCHHSGIDNEEDENAVFTTIIKSHVLKNRDELLEKNEEKKRLVESLEKEINEAKALAERSEKLDKDFKKCQDYLSGMKTHYENRNKLCEKHLAELKTKESELKVLQGEVSKKQEAYDAQGFDGKQHLNFFEIQKKELHEKLDKKHTAFDELQSKYWEAEIELKKISEEAIAAAEQSRELFNNMVESLKDALDPLLSAKKIPGVQKIYENFKSILAVCDVSPNDSRIQSNTSLRDSWKDIAARINNTDEILKKMCSSLKQEVSEIEMKKSEMTMKLKVLSREIDKQKQDLSSKKKMANEDISELEAQYEKICELIQTLQDEKSHLEKTYREMIEEKSTLQEFLEKKQEELKLYLIEQKEMFAYFSRNEMEVMQESEAYGNELADLSEELKTL